MSLATAILEMEWRLIGWQLKGAPGVIEVVARELRNDAASFYAPYNRVQETIFKAYDEQRAVTARTIAADLYDDPGLVELGGSEDLQRLAWESPTVISIEDGQKQALETIRSWRHLKAPRVKPGEIKLVRADSIAPAKIDWVWPGWVAAGKFHVIAGSPGTGKTTLSLALAATITTGGRFACGYRSAVGDVLMWTGEDDLRDSIVPRFSACGGDRSRLHFVEGVTGEDGKTLPFDPASDIERLIRVARLIEDLKLLIVDPLVSAVAGDSHKNAETRRGLQPLVDFAANAGAAVLGITHYTKGTAGRDPVERVTGSLAFTAVPRLVMVTAKPKELGERRRLVRAKSNIGPDGGGFEYDLEQKPIDGVNGVQGQCIAWGKALEGSAQDLLAEVETPPEPGKTSARERAKVWLREFLGAGVVAAKAVEEAAGQMGFAWSTVKRASDELGVVKEKTGFDGGWVWSMPKMLKAA